MSYLDHPRLTFAGQFQADVSTVNNDPRHFDNAKFESRFQDFQTKNTQNGWWNPIGTGIFRFSGCRVRSVVGPDGRPDTDPLIGCLVGNSPEKPSGKIVDLDPDWQLASQLYGLEVSLVDPQSGQLALVATFEPAPFRDLWFSRGGGPGDAGASAMWQSQLFNLRWNHAAINSPVLRLLAESARTSDRLSIRISTFAYQTSVTEQRFTYGSIVGAIGPYREGEPKTFIAGRRFMPDGASGTCVSANGMTCFNAKVIGQTLVADLSNALPLDNTGKVVPLGNLHMAMLRDPAINESALISNDDYVSLGLLDSSENGLLQSSGIQTLQIPTAIQTLIQERPLALVLLGSDGTLGGGQVMLREQPHGRDVRADVFSFRLDPNDPAANRQSLPLVATRYGQPLAGVAIAFQTSAPAPDVGDTPTDQSVGTTPTASIPINNSPSGVLTFEPTVPVTDAEGRARVQVIGPAVLGYPRTYMDGQLYSVAYNFADSEPVIMQTFDQLSVLVFSTFKASAKPTWAEVQPIFQQYANLYPIMSKGLFDFSIQRIADANAHLLYFVLSQPIDSPDQMPVTRDLSSAKRRTLLAYLENVMGSSSVHAPESVARYASRCPFSGVTPSEHPEEVPHKIIFNRLRSR